LSSSPRPHATTLDHPVIAQLRLAAERERAVVDAVAAALGEEAQAAVAKARRAHPAPDLESAAACADPHDGMAEAIAALLRREAAAHAALLQGFGDDAEVRLRLAAFEHGQECGRQIARDAAPGDSGPSAVFDLLHEHLLEELPCRTHIRMVAETPSRVRYAHASCPYARAWAAVSMPHAPACHVLSTWVRGLVHGMDPNVEYRRPKAIALGDARCEHELTLVG
jgi:hypothetical protein